MNEHKLEKMLERIEQTLQHLSRESAEIRGELRDVGFDLECIRVELSYIATLLQPVSTYPRTTGITIQPN